MRKSKYTCDCEIIHQEVVDDLAPRLLDAATVKQAARFFKIMGDPTRVRILNALDLHELCVCDLANLLNMTKSAISHQLRTLRDVNLVKFRREGKTVFYSLSDRHVQDVFEVALDHLAEENQPSTD